jgi:UDP-N-acetylmuramate--alanine ligase
LLKIKDVNIHFIGIGGIGMSGIAHVLLSMEYSVSGSDLQRSAVTDKLEENGAKVYFGHKRGNLKDVTVVVYSSAIDETNPEIIEAREKKIPIMQRAEMLAELMRLKHGLAIAGTHGKTTTTSFLATILQESKYNPTYIIGGVVENLAGHAKVGTGECLVAEADESDGSFLLLNPIMSVITNIDFDHMNYYGSEDNLMSAFETFANKIPFYGLCALNAHDSRLMKIKNRMKKPWTTFGIVNGEEIEADFVADKMNYTSNGSSFDLLYKNEKVCEITIALPGKHNVLNALGAIALAYNMGLSFDQIASSIKKFHGIGRRLEKLLSSDNLEVIDDYAHHPTEISNTLQALKQSREDSKLVVIFEPHRYSRTKECWDSFHHCFNHADKLYLGPIYPASEKPIAGITSNRLAKDINKLHPGMVNLLKSMDDLDGVLAEIPNEKTTVVSLGAGSIGRKIRTAVDNLKK